MDNPNINLSKMPTISPYLIVSDVNAAIEFYKKAFGFELMGEPYVEAEEVVFAAMHYGHALIMLGKAGALKASCNTPHDITGDSPVVPS